MICPHCLKDIKDYRRSLLTQMAWTGRKIKLEPDNKSHKRKLERLQKQLQDYNRRHL